jgi:hypothetical protein
MKGLSPKAPVCHFPSLHKSVGYRRNLASGGGRERVGMLRVRNPFSACLSNAQCHNFATSVGTTRETVFQILVFIGDRYDCLDGQDPCF